MEQNLNSLTPEASAAEVSRLLREDGRFTEEQAVKLARYTELVLRKNQVMNLTAITEPEAFFVKHILDSLSILPKLDRLQTQAKAPLRVLDVGSGAGFPGIPVKIMRPEWRMVLLDSLRKRTLFLDEVIQDLELSSISTLHSRAEDAGRQKNLRETFDVVTARAVASLPVLLELCLPFVKTGGHFLAMKGEADELDAASKALSILGGKPAGREQLTLPGDLGSRVILDILKYKSTPPKYPRKAGVPGKQPLGMV